MQILHRCSNSHCHTGFELSPVVFPAIMLYIMLGVYKTGFRREGHNYIMSLMVSVPYTLLFLQLEIRSLTLRLDNRLTSFVGKAIKSVYMQPRIQ